MTEDSLYQYENIPEKDLGVTKHQNNHFHTFSKEHKLQNFENPMHIVDDLEKHFGKAIKGWDREILEEMARINYNRGLPFTLKEILDGLKNTTKGKALSNEYLRKRISYLEREGFVYHLEERNGHGYQYVLANMVDEVKIGQQSISFNGSRIASSKNNNKYQTYTHDDINIINNLDALVKNKPEPEFHHIRIRSKLKHPEEDYKKFKANPNIEWILSSSRNQGLVHREKISLRRTYDIEVYPNGTVMITIGSSKEPYKWYSREDWISLMATCGAIHQVIKNTVGVSEPLIHLSESDWIVSQLDIGYDCEIDTSKLNISRLFNGAVKIKHLDGVYQIYNKFVPFKGEILRIEDQRNFSSCNSSPTLSLSSLKEQIQPRPITEILGRISS